MSDKCRSCKADVIWARTGNGKLTPIDAAPHVDGNVVLQHQRTEQGMIVHAKTLTRKRQAENKQSFIREITYKSHYATCPQAAKWRRQEA